MDTKENEEENKLKIIIKNRKTFRNRIGSRPMLRIKRVRLIEDSDEENSEKDNINNNNLNRKEIDKKIPITKYRILHSLAPPLDKRFFKNKGGARLCKIRVLYVFMFLQISKYKLNRNYRNNFAYLTERN